MDIQKKRMVVLFTVLISLALFTAGSTAEDTAVNLVPQQTNDVIIVLKETASTAGMSLATVQEGVREKQDSVISDSLDAPGVKNIETFEMLNMIAATVPKDTLAELQNNPNVAAIIPDTKMHLLLEQSVPLIKATTVHQLVVGGANITGTGRGVCVLDTGIDPTHPDLKNNIVAQYCYCTNNGSACCPNNQTELFGNATDENGHGTHVAGIVAANAPATAGGNNLVGVAKNAGIVAVKVFGKDSSTDLSNILKGIDFCIANKNNYSIDVITMSLGTGIFSDAASCDANGQTLAFTDAANTAYGQGIMMLAASGNSANTGGIALPACLSNVTAVGSTTKADAISAFTNRNILLDVLAPGSSINSTAQQNCPAGGSGQVCNNNRYTTLSGTSMATPHVAGLVALANQFSQQFQNRILRVDELRVLLRNTGKKIADAGTGLTFLRIDALELVQTIQEPIKYSQFNNSATTNFAAQTLENLEMLAGAQIGNGDGLVAYPGAVNFVKMNLNESISIKPGNIIINISREPRLNATAVVTMKNPPVLNGFIFDDGKKCASCMVMSSSGDNTTFNVTNFDAYGNFTTSASAVLTIFDDNDAQRGSKNSTVDDDITFFANYTNTTGAPIVGNANCTITIENVSHAMVYNATSSYYEYTTFFTTEKSIDWNGSCSASDTTPAAAQDTITIYPFVAACKQYTKPNRNILMNASLEYGGNGTCMTLSADNITLDCDGFSFVSKNTNVGTGMAMTTNNARVKSCTLTNFSTGILFDGAANAQVNDSATNGALGMKGFGGRNQLINTTTTSKTIEANTTTSVELDWYLSVNTTNNNSQPLLTNMTITLQNGSTITTKNVSAMNFLLVEGVYGAVNDILTPHTVTVEAGTYTKQNKIINLSQTMSTALTMVLSQLPSVATFDGNTTNFNAAPNLANGSDLFIEKKERGSVNFTGGKDARGRDFDNAIRLSDRLVSVNTTMLGSEYNNTARVTIKNVTCPTKIVAAEAVYTAADKVRAAGFVCSENSSTACINVVCTDNAVSFTANHFSSFTVEPNAGVVLSSDSPKQPNQTVTMQLNYRNSTSNEVITDAVCFLTVNNDTSIAAFNAASNRYERVQSFTAEGLYRYNATCDGVLFTKLSEEGILNISLSAPNTSSTGNTGTGSTGGGAAGGGGGGGGGPTQSQQQSRPASTLPASAPASISSIGTTSETSSDGEAAAQESESSFESATESETAGGDGVTGAATAEQTETVSNDLLTGRIAGVGKALGFVKEDGEFSMFGLGSILTLLTLGALGLGSFSYRKITHLDSDSAARLKTSIGSLGIASDALSFVRQKSKTLVEKLKQKLPHKKKYLFEEGEAAQGEQDKKFEF
ncbi:MAG: S8 family serine peptidase [Candidatus Woesearchaeota archaeon]|nr:S8 family serine peptidase [Candidatus Woesearchaeota archaeon]